MILLLFNSLKSNQQNCVNAKCTIPISLYDHALGNAFVETVGKQKRRILRVHREQLTHRHSTHVYSFFRTVAWPPVACVRKCILMLHFLVNVLPHTSHLYGFSPVCVRRCLVSWLFLANAVSQTSHLYGLSAACVRWCFVRPPFLDSLAPCTSHLYGSSLAYGRRPIVKESGNGFSAVCVRRCVVKLQSELNDMPHTSHLNSWSLDRCNRLLRRRRICSNKSIDGPRKFSGILLNKKKCNVDIMQQWLTDVAMP